ncbi:LTA synthase family protein [Alkaliflexus imshenetskii]|uniref:LTA synthase family protein n=1 Tax=Alkaliflexus imshenetskii TaxID=286730 RepID=UPI000478955A|nr:alkaline phosphatase family protein [Alkaliflexus imshenetskii]
MLNFLKYFLKSAIFWLVFFAIFRLGFILVNLSYAGDASFGAMAASFLVGLRLDLSMTGYVLILTCVHQAVTLLVFRRFVYIHLNWLHYTLVGAFSALLLANIHLYAYWGRHLDAEAFGFLKTPGIILASLRWWEVLLFGAGLFVLSALFIAVYRRWVSENFVVKRLKFLNAAIAAFVVLFLGALMIIPIRGSFGVAPINTGVAYFSRHMYANHAAINPLWNLFYSFKRVDARTRHYKFMDEEKAKALFLETVYTEGATQKIINTERPNVVIILLESFSTQVIGRLGGNPVTPNFDKLVTEGVLFSNIYAASDRSDKGLVATLAGYQVMPAYSIIQYPAKSQSLSFLPERMREAGYGDMTYMYGGDIGFKGMNSFVTLAGFDQIISISDFPRSSHGQKWGVHDEYTFQRLAEEMKKAEEPYFKFYFTLSSHEPFDVPMEKVFDDPYLNSIHYTDRCLGEFIDTVKRVGLWENTLFVLIADHGVPGPLRATSQMKERYHIPMLWTGGAIAKKDTVVKTLGSQTDMVSTLLNQLDLSTNGFDFSKNLMAETVSEFAFFTYPDAFGFITPTMYQVFDNRANRFIVFEGEAAAADSLKGKAYLQVLSADHLKR